MLLVTLYGVDDVLLYPCILFEDLCIKDLDSLASIDLISMDEDHFCLTPTGQFWLI